MRKNLLKSFALAFACACAALTFGCALPTEEQKQEELEFASVNVDLVCSADNPEGWVSAYYYSTMRMDRISVVKGADITHIGKDYEPQGDYYRLYAAEAEMIALWIKPPRELSYYQEMKQKGYTGVSFDYYAKQTRMENVINPDGSFGATYNGLDYICYNGKYDTGTPIADKWTTVTLSIDTIIRDYELMSAGTYSPTMDGKTAYAKTFILTVIDWQPQELDVYVGNFRSVKTEA